jgi:uncharacterized membrane protein
LPLILFAGAPFHSGMRIFGALNPLHMKFQKVPKQLFHFFLQGVLVLAPISITVWTVIAVFNWIDGILPNLVHSLFPSFIGTDQYGLPKRIPGLGFIVFITIALFVGYISPSFIVSRFMDFSDKVLEKTPGIKLIYSTLKDFFEAFAGSKRKFDKAVLVSIEAPDVWRVGFITQEELHEFGLQEYVAVYVPQSYAFAGHLYFVKRDRVRILTDISSADAMKFAISGGVAEVEDHEHVPNQPVVQGT